MSVNVSVETTKLHTETVATGLVITRTVDPTTAQAFYTATLQFGTHTFLVDASDKPISALSLNQNPGCIVLGVEEMGSVFMTPIKTADGTDTVLGAVLADMMDAKIAAFLTPPVEPDPVSPVDPTPAL